MARGSGTEPGKREGGGHNVNETARRFASKEVKDIVVEAPGKSYSNYVREHVHDRA